MRGRAVVALLFVGGVAIGASQCSSDEAESASASHLTQRLWVERMPEHERDMIRKFALVRSIEHGRFGVAERGSVWRHRTEVFKWGLHDGRLRMYFPQSRRDLTARVRTWECEGEAPAGFELCLEIRGESGRSIRMYSRHEWKLRPRASEDIVEDGPLAQWHLPVLVETSDDAVSESKASSVADLFPE